jgi:hypothetical protein
MSDEILETVAERASHRSTVPEALAIATFTALAIGLFAFGILAREPYPSMTLPGFGHLALSTGVPASQTRLEVVFASATEETRLSLAEIFFDASISDHLRLHKTTSSLNGTEAEWDWIERVARHNGFTSCVLSVTVVETNGTETDQMNRLDRTC